MADQGSPRRPRGCAVPPSRRCEGGAVMRPERLGLKPASSDPDPSVAGRDPQLALHRRSLGCLRRHEIQAAPLARQRRSARPCGRSSCSRPDPRGRAAPPATASFTGPHARGRTSRRAPTLSWVSRAPGEPRAPGRAGGIPQFGGGPVEGGPRLHLPAWTGVNRRKRPAQTTSSARRLLGAAPCPVGYRAWGRDLRAIRGPGRKRSPPPCFLGTWGGTVTAALADRAAPGGQDQPHR